MSAELKTVLDGLAFPESPRWHGGARWFSDMHAHEVVSLAPDGSRRTAAAFDGPVSGLGWLPAGQMLVVSMAGKRVLRQEADGARGLVGGGDHLVGEMLDVRVEAFAEVEQVFGRAIGRFRGGEIEA